MKKEYIKVILFWLLSIIVIVGISFCVNYLFVEKPDNHNQKFIPVVKEEMTIGQLALENKIEKESLKKIFSIKTPSNFEKRVSDFNLNTAQIINEIRKIKILQEENHSKNWIKIPLKFFLWFIFMGIVLHQLKKGMITEKKRKYFYITAFIIFGVILGADPSPMGTVKDAVVLYGIHGTIFPPRLIAFCIFILTVIIANKFICSWGCQFGVFQDFIFRINRKNDKNILPQFKVPFIISQVIRIIFFIITAIIVFIWAVDIIGFIDPFKTFKPATLTVIGGIFILFILIISLFIYRPWCTFFCPFGLTGWIAEKFSIINIKINYDSCIACEKCSRACPSTVMESYLKQNKVKPDCFSCGTCIENCPTGSISFASGKRIPVPDGKFQIIKHQ